MALFEEQNVIFSKCRWFCIIQKFVPHRRLIVQARTRHSYLFQQRMNVLSFHTYACFYLAIAFYKEKK